jgi:hypothetical protein
MTTPETNYRELSTFVTETQQRNNDKAIVSPCTFIQGYNNAFRIVPIQEQQYQVCMNIDWIKSTTF